MAEVFVIASNDLTSVEKPTTNNCKEQNKSETNLNREDHSKNSDKQSISVVAEYHGSIRNNTNFHLHKSNSKSTTEEQSMVKKKRNQVESTEHISSSNLEPKPYPKILSPENQKDCIQSLDEEKLWHESRAKKRRELFEAILTNEAVEFSWSKTVFYPMIIVLASSLLAVPYCLFPAHDLVKFPEYWYEILYHAAFLFTYDWVFWCFPAGHFLNMRCLQQIRTLLRGVCIIGGVFVFAFFTSTYYIWTNFLSFNYPIPFLGYTSVSVGWVTGCILIWLSIPTDWRKNADVRKRMKNYVILRLILINQISLQQSLILAVSKFRGQYQPLLALGFPVIRELITWIGKKIIKRCANGDTLVGSLVFMYTMSSNHTILLCYVISSIADDTTSWTLIASDFLINVYLSLRVVWEQKRHTNSGQLQINLLQELAVYELLETIASLSFLLVFTMAYFTPVGVLIGNISNGYWAFNAVEDITFALTKMSIMSLAGFSSTIVSGAILWFACNINLGKVLLQLQRELFKTFILISSYSVLAVRKCI